MAYATSCFGRICSHEERAGEGVTRLLPLEFVAGRATEMRKLLGKHPRRSAAYQSPEILFDSVLGIRTRRVIDAGGNEGLAARMVGTSLGRHAGLVPTSLPGARDSWRRVTT